MNVPMGITFEAVKIFMPAGSKRPVVVHYIEHIPPDVTAGMFWLKNRDPRCRPLSFLGFDRRSPKPGAFTAENGSAFLRDFRDFA
jgi:hypothetical protein